MRCKLVAAIFILYANSAFGQTASDIEAKYGKPVNNAYSVSEHVWMTPEYTVDGQVCRMRLYPKGIPPNPNHEFIALPFEVVKNTLNQLVPLKARGAKQRTFDIFETLGGGTAKVDYPYEKVTFTFYFLFRVEFPAGLKTTEVSAQGFPEDKKLNEKMQATEDDFSPSKEDKGDKVIIEWKDRKCVGR